MRAGAAGKWSVRGDAGEDRRLTADRGFSEGRGSGVIESNQWHGIMIHPAERMMLSTGGCTSVDDQGQNCLIFRVDNSMMGGRVIRGSLAIAECHGLPRGLSATTAWSWPLHALIALCQNTGVDRHYIAIA